VRRASRGEFAISFNGETMPNIDAGTSEVGRGALSEQYSHTSAGVQEGLASFRVSTVADPDSDHPVSHGEDRAAA